MRPGVGKTLVLVSCGSLQETTHFGDAITLLKETGIILHHFTPTELSFKGVVSKKKSKLQQLLGFSRDEVFTVRGPESDLRRLLKDPKDPAFTLAVESDGTVFDLNRLEVKPTAKKVALEMANQVAIRSHPDDCQVCNCVADSEGGHGSLSCHKCIISAMDIVLHSWEMYGKHERH